MDLKKNFIKRVASILLCFTVLAVQLCLVAFADTQTVKYTVENVTGKKGETVVVPIKLVTSDGKKIEVNGIMLSVTYDQEKLEYVESSVTTSVNGLAVNNKDGKVTLAGTDTSSSKIPSDTTILTVNFRIKDSATGNSTEITVKSGDIYKSSVVDESVQYTHYTCTTPTVKATVNFGEDSAVQKVVDSINAIGTVKNTEECYNKIKEASRLYGKLTVKQQANVTNYSKLLEAEETYNKLRAEEAQKPIDDEVAKFKNDHAKALAVRLNSKDEENDLTLDKYDILEKAYKQFGTGEGKLSAAAQAELMTEYRRLGYYLELLKDAKAADDVNKKLEQLKQWEYQLCQAYVNGGYEIDPLTGEYVKENGKKVWITGLTEKKNKKYVSEWADILGKTKKNVTAIDYTRLDYFKTSWYDNLTALHPDIETVMNNEHNGLAKQFLEAYEKAYELYLKENPQLTEEQIAANKFRSKFAYVLGLTTSTVTYEDLSQIEMALAVYEFLSDDTKALLTKEYTLLENLKSTASNKTPAGSGSDISGPAGSLFDTSAEASSLYNAFTQTWAKVFAMNPDEITANDYATLQAMITNYETICALNPEVATLLSEQMKSVYSMYDKAKELSGNADTNIAGPAVAGWDSDTVLEFLGRDIGVVVWILLAMLALSTTIFVVLRIFYHSLKKNKALFAEEVAI